MHRRRTKARALGLVVPLALALSLSACGSDESTKKAELPTANDALQGEITLGAVLPLTGTNATIGKDQQRGIELAVAKINEGEGVLGKKLVVDIEDSQGTADAAIQAAKKLVSVSKVPAVIGEYSSGNSIPMQQYLESQGVVGVNPGSSSIELRTTGELQFSTIGLDDVAGAFTAGALRDKGYDSIAILAPNNSYGTGIVSSVSDAFEELGGTVTTTGLYTEGQADYRQELGRLKDTKPDAYVVTTYGKDGTVINKEMYELGMTEKPVFDIYLSQDVPDADPKSVEGRLGMDVNSTSADGKDYSDYYEDAYGEKFISSFNGYAYDAVMLLAAAIDQAGSTDAKAIAAALTEVSKTYDGATGPIAFDADGQRSEQPYVVAEVKDGEIVPQ
ncbi:ABC transporter substrate-binding protein [Nocardioides nitrophenolicus]|uniref:ABC transporter substrate-binding protein n=1 Tax=Nocardioides nitrophenolicus TaxID=60489 RepID=UPI00195707A7|nr:ABC transporter substrate-binding protein [Nocardioides nitrophenolicus]MBM7518667.1 branched-chain amino acid transport system substrate-binding protein [Nocardioides nitrophenolicus]